MRTARPLDLTAVSALRASFPEPSRLRAELLNELGPDPSLLQLSELTQLFEADAELRRGVRALRLNVLADMTVGGMLIPLRAFAWLRGLDLQIDVRPAYQFEPELLGPLRDHKSDALLALLDLEKAVCSGVASPTAQESDAFYAMLQRRLDLLAEHATRTGTKVVVSDFVSSHGPLSPAFDHLAAFGRRAFVQAANQWLYEACQERQLDVLSIAGAIARWGEERCLSLKQYLSVDALFTASGNNCVAQLVTRQLAAHFTPRKKVLALDLDNTLWGGVLGEDGPDGIQYRPDSYQGRVYHAVLTFMKALSETGILLAIASKNNESEVLELLRRDDFPLELSDFAAHRINWQPKPDSLRSIAEELNLGLDSFVFLDDSPIECALMRRTLPEVAVVRVPETISDYPSCLRNIEGFDRPRLTDADRERKSDYQLTRKRRELATRVTSLDEFIQELQICLEISPATASNLERVAQLFERTNQFNLSQIRYRREALQPLLDDPLRLLCIDYSDRFGPSGLVGALVLTRTGDVACSENFVLSCRVLGRKVEHAVLGAIASRLAADGCKRLRFNFVASERNQPASEFLDSLGVRESLSLELPAQALCPPPIRVVWREARGAETVEQRRAAAAP
jgi:FkbH-like protein